MLLGQSAVNASCPLRTHWDIRVCTVALPQHGVFGTTQVPHHGIQEVQSAAKGEDGVIERRTLHTSDNATLR